MFGRRIDRLTGRGLSALVLAISTMSADADSLTIALHRDTVLLYEPLVVQVTLTLDEPFIPNAQDPHEALKQLGRLRRRLYIELREPGAEKMSEGFLAYIAFPRAEEPTRGFRATGLGFLGRDEQGGEGFAHWKNPGDYVVVVTDKENRLESNEIAVTLRTPKGTDLEAARIFQAGGLDAMNLIVQQEYSRKETLVGFQRLARDYSETPYGKYAMVSLALIRWKNTFARHNVNGEASVWIPVVAELKEAAKSFDGSHPLRGQALFQLARAQVLAGSISQARHTAVTLCAEFANGVLEHKARALLSELPQSGADEK